MKAILEFNLPEEELEHRDALNGSTYSSALQDFDNFLRGKLKYSELTDEQYKIFDEIRSELYDTCQNHGFNIWE